MSIRVFNSGARHVAVIVGTLALTACATGPTAAGARVAEADTSMIQGCKYLGDVEGSSGWGNLAASSGMENAKNEARDKAARLGASHIVWNAVTGGYSPFASGKAYKC